MGGKEAKVNPAKFEMKTTAWGCEEDAEQARRMRFNAQLRMPYKGQNTEMRWCFDIGERSNIT